MDVCQYRATSVSQIVPLNRYTIWMQTTFKEVRRDIIGCCSLLAQVYLWLFTHSSLASPNDVCQGGWHYWHTKIYTSQYSFTPSCLDAFLHLDFPSSSDEKRVKIKAVFRLNLVGLWSFVGQLSRLAEGGCRAVCVAVCNDSGTAIEISSTYFPDKRALRAPWWHKKLLDKTFKKLVYWIPLNRRQFIFFYFKSLTVIVYKNS